MTNIDFSSTPITIKIAYTKPAGYEEIATAPGGYGAGSYKIVDKTVTGIAIRGFKTNNEILIKSGQDYTFKTESPQEAMYYRNYAKVAGVTVTINDSIVNPSDVASWSDLVDDVQDIEDETIPEVPSLKVVAFKNNTTDLFGKTVDQLQSEASIEDGIMTAQLNYISDYTSAGYDMSKGNHFAVVKATPSVEGNIINIKFNETDKNLDEDGILILQMTNEKKELVCEFTEKNGDTVVSTYSLKFTGLVLNAQ